MGTSYFTDLSKIPENEDLKTALGVLYPLWMEIRSYVFENYPVATEEWHIAVKKYGWGFRIKDKKRAIVYLSPKHGYFKVTFVFGQKATDEVLAGNFRAETKKALRESKVYMEGRVLVFEIRNSDLISEIKNLVLIKLAH